MKEAHLLRNLVEVEGKLYQYRNNLLAFVEHYAKEAARESKNKRRNVSEFMYEELQDLVYFLLEEAAKNPSIMHDETMNSNAIEEVVLIKNLSVQKRGNVSVEEFTEKVYQLHIEEDIVHLTFLENLMFYLTTIIANRAALLYYREKVMESLALYFKAIELINIFDFRNVFKVTRIFIQFNCAYILKAIKDYYDGKRMLFSTYRLFQNSLEQMQRGYLRSKTSFLLKYILLLKNTEASFCDSILDRKYASDSMQTQKTRLRIFNGYIHDMLAFLLEMIGEYATPILIA